MSELRDKIINHIIEIEGGYVDDPSDSGGATNFGITEKVARANGYFGDMRDMPRSMAFDIYKEKYWDAMRLDQVEKMSSKVAYELADTGINMGVGRATEFLQRSLNALNDGGKYYPDIKVDRDFGPTTLNTLTHYMSHRKTEVLLKALNCLQGAFYITLAERREKDERFLSGWLDNRVDIPGG